MLVVWLELLSDPVLEQHVKLMEKHFNQAVLDEQIVFYMLHPSYKGINLTAKQLDTVNEWITMKDTSFITSLINDQAQVLPFHLHLSPMLLPSSRQLIGGRPSDLMECHLTFQNYSRSRPLSRYFVSIF